MPLLNKNTTLFKVFGIPISMNISWLFLFALIVFTLSARGGLLDHWINDPSVSRGTYWVLGFIGALGLFASLIAHELCHSVVARSTGMPVKGITLFIFGGVSELGDEPPTAGSELLMAIVGPISSVVIGGVFLAAWLVGRTALSAPIDALLRYLWTINFILAAFNSLPAFPLDGGRVLRSVLWGLTGSLRKATSIAAGVGSTFGLLMIVGGVFVAFSGGVIAGIWLVFIGLFLRQSAQASFQHTMVRQALQGEPVRQFMTRDPLTVSPDTDLHRFVEDYVLPNHFSVFPVVDASGRLLGVARARDATRFDRAQWQSRTVGDIMSESQPETEVHPDTDAVEALARFQGEPGKRIFIVDEEHRPIGVVSLRDLLDFLALKIDLGPRRARS